MPVGSLSGYGGGAVPSGFLLCDGASYLRADYAALFAVIGTTFGAPDGTHFKVPDLRGRIPLGKAASGTGSGLGETGGTISHTHSLANHSHAVTQAATHTAHTVTQPAAHSALSSHSSAAMAAHSALSHSGITVSDHAISAEASAHGTHASGGAHTHDSHGATVNTSNAGVTTVYSLPDTHSSDGGHTHDAHSAHTGSTIDAHSISGPANHSGDTHSVTQASDHGSPSHSGATVTGAHAHTGAATGLVGGATGVESPPFQAAPYMIQAA